MAMGGREINQKGWEKAQKPGIQSVTLCHFGANMYKIDIKN
jgi:hypothetical protein